MEETVEKRVWQRVQGEPDRVEALRLCLSRQGRLWSAYRSLSRRGGKCRTLLEQKENQIACLRGMLRVLTGIPIYPFLLVGYAVALAITFFVPPLYTGIAFDSGGVASGPMTTTFMLPFAIGACEMMGGDVLTDAFGIVAMVAMAPLITIQVMGLYGRVEMNRKRKRMHSELIQIADDILYFEEV